MPIPAYISGFVDKSGLDMPIHSLNFRTPRKRAAVNGIRPISRIEIIEGVGLLDYSTVKEFEKIKELHLGDDMPFIIAGINKEVDGKFYASSGLLDFKGEKWENLVKRI
jgi:hypothetical protein